MGRRTVYTLLLLYLLGTTCAPAHSRKQPCCTFVHAKPMFSIGDGLVFQSIFLQIHVYHNQSRSVYWRRCKRFSYKDDSQIPDILDKTGLRHWWYTRALFCMRCVSQELALVCYTAYCICFTPWLFAAVLLKCLFRYAGIARMEVARCLGEVVLLSSTLDAWSANPCAILALSLWLVGFHCNCFAACRALTLVLLQLSQQNLTLLRFLLISLLAYAAPLFGKRGAPKPKAKSESKKQKVVNSAIAVQSATLPSKRYRTALAA